MPELPSGTKPATRLGAASRFFAALFLLCFNGATYNAAAQAVQVDLGAIEGIELRPENAFAFTVINTSNATKNALVKGTLKFKGMPLQASYTFSTTLQPGTTVFNRERAGNPAWQFSSSALRDLFLTYGKLPQGTYEYCVELSFPGAGGEGAGYPVDACTYQTVEDIFLINLIEPEDNAKLYEHNPMLSWVVNYPFASELTYRVRVAELKSGQNAASAIARNNPVYAERNVLATTTTYPVTARPLQTWQPYAWTVDAYYQGLLLGGAEPWRFTIIEDSALAGIPRETYHIDIRNEKSTSGLYAIGALKIKYMLDESRQETLRVELFSEGELTKPLFSQELSAEYGDNRFEVDLSGTRGIRHLHRYTFQLTTARGEQYTLPVRYVNPDFLK